MPRYLTCEHDDYNDITELQICLAEALYDMAESSRLCPCGN